MNLEDTIGPSGLAFLWCQDGPGIVERHLLRPALHGQRIFRDLPHMDIALAKLPESALGSHTRRLSNPQRGSFHIGSSV